MKRVVITGMGAITPVGNDVAAMWSSIVAGKHGIGPITRFDCSQFKTKIAAEVKDFDPMQYMERAETKRTDIYCQFAMAAASQAVEDSGIVGKVESERFGVYFGSGIGGISTFITENGKEMTSGPRRVSPYFIPMMISNIAAGNLAIKYNATGPCVAVTTACATGSTALGEAYRAIRHGYADAIIAGGAEAAITTMGVAGFINMTALSTSDDPDAASLPFDRRRDGFVMGEGAGALILEEYEHALKRNAHIYAELAGYGSTCDAYHMTTPDPSSTMSSKAIADALNETGDWMGKRIYINAHGTGTPVNDPTETKAIKMALGSNIGNTLVSSTKSMTGHMLGASGAVEAIIAIKSLETGIIPPTAGLIEQDPDCDLDYVPLKARLGVNPELAVSVSLGFGGHNACVAFRRV